MKNISIKDVAEYAGVSVTTVSRVLNKRGYISESTYQKVNDAIEHLDYHPNQVARSLFNQRTNTIGFLLPVISYPFFASLTEQIEMALYKKGYKLLICDTIGTIHRERDYLKMLRENKVDGIIIGNHNLDFDEYLKLSASMPIVAIDIKLSKNIPVIASNHRKGGELAARKLIENGCRKVVQIKGFSREGIVTTDRHEEFQRQMNTHSVECITIHLNKEDFKLDEHARIIDGIFKEYKEIDGLFAVDIIAARALKYAIERNINVPKDLKIVGYDGTLLTQLTYPTITTIRQSFESIAEAIVNTLEKLINGEEITKQINYCDVELVEGGTTL